MNAVPNLHRDIKMWEGKELDRKKTCAFLTAELCVQDPVSKRQRADLAKKQSAIDALAQSAQSLEDQRMELMDRVDTELRSVRQFLEDLPGKRLVEVKQIGHPEKYMVVLLRICAMLMGVEPVMKRDKYNPDAMVCE